MKNKNASVGFIFVTLLLDVIGFGIIIPVMPDLIMELTGEEESGAALYGGWLLLSYSLFQFFSAPIIGGLSNQFGRRKVLLISLFGFGVDYIFLALAPNIWWLFVGRIISGITGASFTTGSAYIADISPPEKRSANFGLIGVAFGLGFIIGPALGGFLGQYGSRVPFYAAAVLTLVNWLYGLLVLPESLPESKRTRFSWARANPIGTFGVLKRYPKVIGLLAAIFFVYVASHAVQSTWAFFTKYRFGWDVGEIGLSLTFVGLLSALVQGWLIRIVIPKLGQERSIYLGLVFSTIGLILFSIASTGAEVYAYMVVYCLGGIASPALQGLMSNEVPDTEQGELQGANSSMMSLSAIIGPPVMTGLFSYYSSSDATLQFPGAPMVLGAGLTVLCLYLTWNTLRKYRKPSQ